jgi:hypothetical protein
VNGVRQCYWKRIERQAGRRKKDFEISIEYAAQVLQQQGERCALTGLVITANATEDLITASVDRIDNELGYVKGNIQWVHKAVNMMRGPMDVAEFVKLCALVAKESSKNDRPKQRGNSD